MSDRHNDDAGNGGGGIRVGDVRPGEPPIVHITPSGVVVNEADGATWYAKDGSTVTLRADCSFELKNPVVERIEIDNALLIVDYRLVRTPDTTSHVIDFEGGGVFAFLRDA